MLEPFVDASLEALESGVPVSAAALTVLLRVYAATGRDDVGAAIGRALAAAMAGVSRDASIEERADRLLLFVEAAQLSDDARLLEAATAAATDLETACASHAAISFGARAAAVHAVLTACALVDAQRFAPPAIDEVERLVASAYAPGKGLQDRSPAESVTVALALLAAFDVTGRLAYPMLAEELMRAARDALAGAAPSSRCDAARVFDRLARLYADDGYRATAVVAPDADYAREASELLDRCASACVTTGDKAAYALALTEHLDRS
jgi:hypothetical protein